MDMNCLRLNFKPSLASRLPGVDEWCLLGSINFTLGEHMLSSFGRYLLGSINFL